MKLFKTTIMTLCMSFFSSAFAGGLLTNTNQNVTFLRNPARDAAIGIDGVYSNPAGVIFLGEGFHLSLNIQNAHQTRTIRTTSPLFINNANHSGQQMHEFEGEADVPILPSFQAAWNKGNWSFQFGFAITGGGGKCKFEEGLGSFEQVVAGIPYKPVGSSNAMTLMNQLYGGLGAIAPSLSSHQMGNKYAYDSYMRGRQYYYGFTVGAAYKVSENLSLYGGLRMLYGSANYYGYVKNIQVEHIANGQSTMVAASQHFAEQALKFSEYAGRLEQMGMAEQAGMLQQGATLSTALSQGTQDIELNCDQTGWGVAPIIGVDYKTSKLNVAAKYEFKTRMRLKNKSANSLSAENISMLDKFKDGEKVAEDSPALLTIGAQYCILPSLRVMAGWHHYFDVDTKQYTKDMLGDSNEYLFGAEYDICKKLEVSAGMQRTEYDLKDAVMNDISFNVSSYSVGFGFGYKVNEKVKINAAYFQTFYDDYNKAKDAAGVTNSFTRTNRVIGVGVDLKF
ncbi:MAG: OmpP1/FadL family transporter [Prevotella sp.]